MTNRERLISFVGFAPQPDAVDGALIDAGIDGTATYTAAQSIPLKTQSIALMELLLTTANTNDGASVFGVSYDRNAVLARIKMYKQELGITDDSLPVISSKPWW